jgi:ParB family chromosome partitioning protein
VKHPDIKRLEADISEELGALVTIDHGAKGNGKIVIRYASLDELDGVLGHIRKGR